MKNINEEKAFVLMKTNLNTTKVVQSVLRVEGVKWAKSLFGPYQLIALVQAKNKEALIEKIEWLRAFRPITELDARYIKIIPEDSETMQIGLLAPEQAVLLINVNYHEIKERTLTAKLRKIQGVSYARAMWGPADIIAIVSAPNKESLRNLICDSIKIQKGVKTNTTLYCY
jgi:hypothetical protein